MEEIAGRFQRRREASATEASPNLHAVQTGSGQWRCTAAAAIGEPAAAMGGPAAVMGGPAAAMGGPAGMGARRDARWRRRWEERRRRCE
jgi:hypothetical protein